MSTPWHQTLFGRNSSKNIAKERLKLVLLHDRNDFSPQLINTIKDEIITILSKYVEIDEQSIDIELTRAQEPDEELSAFVANIPIVSVKDNLTR